MVGFLPTVAVVFLFSLAWVNAQPPCNASFVGHTYTACTNGKRSAVYFYQSPCTPSSYVLPQTIPNLPCVIECDEGTVLPFASISCVDCAPGYYSVGGIAYTTWNGFPADFSTDCTGNRRCSPWVVNGNSVSSGNNRGLVNIFSNLRLRAQFFNPVENYIRFTFKVDAESCRTLPCDGVSFYIDDILQFYVSHQLFWTTVTYNVTKGYHLFRWTYSKDYSVDFGQDSAFIQSIEVIGTKNNIETCSPCPPGTYSSSARSAECTPCDFNTYNPSPGQPSCLPCNPGSASLEGSSSCLVLPACTSANYFYKRSSCDPTTLNETRTYTYYGADEEVPACNPNAAGAAPIPPTQVVPCQCGPGTQLNPSLAICEFCPSGTNQSSYVGAGVSCAKCANGTYALKTRRYDDWSYLQPEFQTSCQGECGSDGWIPRGSYMGSGFAYGGVMDTLLTIGNVTIGPIGGEVRFVYSAINCGYSYLNSRCFLQFFVDSDTEDLVIYDVTPGQNRVAYLPLAAGVYSFTWRYSHTAPEFNVETNARLQTLTFSGVIEGGAMYCQDCPAGSGASPDQSQCNPCPIGTYSSKVNSPCIAPADGYFVDTPGSTQPVQCGPGTTSSPDHQSCVTDCTFSPSPGINFNLNQLYSPEMYFAGVDVSSSKYYLSICSPQIAKSNATCVDLYGNPLSTFGCRKTARAAGDFDLGRVIGFLPLNSSDPNSFRKGLTVTFTNGTICPRVPSRQASTKIIFNCDPDAGLGAPIPAYEQGPENPIGSCQFVFNWVSSVACPLCTSQDYETLISNCTDGVQTITKIRISDCYEPSPIVPATQSCQNCLQDSNGSPCSNRGSCDLTNGKCYCEGNWTGTICEICKGGYYGSSCQYECPGGLQTVCNGHGVCSSGTKGTGKCTCSTGWTGPLCNQCDEGFEGTSCTTIPAAITDVVPWWAIVIIVGGVVAIIGVSILLYLQKRRLQKEYQILLTNQPDPVQLNVGGFNLPSDTQDAPDNEERNEND